MSERDTSRTSDKLYRGLVEGADSPTTAGMRDVPIGGANQYVPNSHKIFHVILQEMSTLHDRKRHDYTTDENPYGNYIFAGQMSQLFEDHRDAGFVGRIGEKLFRLANLENDGKKPLNESIEDTENDICTIMVLWVASRRQRRISAQIKADFTRQAAMEAQTTEPLTNAAKGQWHDGPLSTHPDYRPSNPERLK